MKRGRWKFVAVTAGVVGLLAAIGGTAQPGYGRIDGSAKQAKTIKVGVVYSRTGLLSAYGAEFISGFRLGLQYATNCTNKVGGNTIVADVPYHID